MKQKNWVSSDWYFIGVYMMMFIITGMYISIRFSPGALVLGPHTGSFIITAILFGVPWLVATGTYAILELLKKVETDDNVKPEEIEFEKHRRKYYSTILFVKYSLFLLLLFCGFHPSSIEYMQQLQWYETAILFVLGFSMIYLNVDVLHLFIFALIQLIKRKQAMKHDTATE